MRSGERPLGWAEWKETSGDPGQGFLGGMAGRDDELVRVGQRENWRFESEDNENRGLCQGAFVSRLEG